jgi:hypothetical protein
MDTIVTALVQFKLSPTLLWLQAYHYKEIRKNPRNIMIDFIACTEKVDGGHVKWVEFPPFVVDYALDLLANRCKPMDVRKEKV